MTGDPWPAIVAMIDAAATPLPAPPPPPPRPPRVRQPRAPKPARQVVDAEMAAAIAAWAASLPKARRGR